VSLRTGSDAVFGRAIVFIKYVFEYVFVYVDDYNKKIIFSETDWEIEWEK